MTGTTIGKATTGRGDAHAVAGTTEGEAPTAMHPMRVARKAALKLALKAAVAMAAVVMVAAPVAAQQVFDTAEAASNALGDAIARSDQDALRKVLGNQYRTLLPPEGITQDDIYDFLGAWAAHHALQPAGDNAMRIAVGDSGWTFPAPIVKRPAGWQFDLKAGREEVRDRRIARNELVAMDSLLQLADAQQRYAQQVGNGAFAKRIVSSRGRTDGLYWPSDTEADASPIGPDALAMGPDVPPEDAYYGYRFRVLPPGTGAGATRFAFIAWPARYGESGVHTFLIDAERNFYERDLGTSTASRAAAMRSFSTEGWRRVADK